MEMKRPTPIHILLPEEIPIQNKGEAAIFYGMIESFAALGDFRLINISKYPEDMGYSGTNVRAVNYPLIHMENGLVRALFDVVIVLWVGCLERILGKKLALMFCRSSIWKDFIRSELVLLGHDNVFCPTIRPRNIPIALYTKLSGKKLICYGASLGPFKGGRLERLICKTVLRCFDLITLRDEYSLEEIKKLNAKIIRPSVTADLAFLMKPMATAEMVSLLEKSGHKGIFDRPIVGITATRFLAERIERYEGKRCKGFDGKYEVYCRVLADCASHLIDRYEVNVALIAHVVGPSNWADDRSVNNDIATLVQNKEHLFVINEDLPVDALKSLIGCLSLLIGSRTHSMIGALSQCIPVVAITDRARFKTNGLFEELHISDCLYFIEDLANAEFLGKVADTWVRREKLARVLRTQIPIYIRKAEQNSALLSLCREPER